MKHNYIDRAKVFIEAVYPYLNNLEQVVSVSGSIRRFNTLKHRKVIVSSGLSRIALITSDYVIKWDYSNKDFYGNCETEYRLYNEHKDDNFSYLLTPIHRYVYNNHAFYIMPRVMKIAERISEDVEIGEFLNDDEYTYIFYDLGLYDLHSGNWGFTHGRPAIFDYAWYRKDEEEDEEEYEYEEDEEVEG